MSADEAPPVYISKRTGPRFLYRPDLMAKYNRRLHRPRYNSPTPFQRKFHIFTHVFMFGLGYYMVFLHDFGPEEHCLSWLQRWHSQKVNEFWTLNQDETDELKQLKTKKE
ncbi:hypothetical protein H4R34_004844 [Dimargaris verticillata]|uniref:Uncharacterized protein n=1 Tax=Dimargaris verticillata TaxID=2761393 RepID=A0A9W8E7Q4_9FUNG|nr:hypothetical protein H4R34_004844 [Dimargaris verticillata]